MSENFLQMLDSSSNHSELLAGELPANWPVIHARRPSVDFQVWASNENIFFIFYGYFTARELTLDEMKLNWGPIYKISYDNLTIVLRQCQSYDRLTTDV